MVPASWVIAVQLQNESAMQRMTQSEVGTQRM